ncbi:MAG: DegT/DnrJ/EryC1/StrS family aminotransferase [Candidatus Blackburnbacteria bacterium]|nr:DegT/DnrJ/EryC1/StrS family aminotransferase [Candidatus Blackburnbacteria bacterium]
MILALKTLLNPFRWFGKNETESLESSFEQLFPGYKALAINSGRSAEYLILKTLGVGKGDEVLVQDFTCVAVPNSVCWLGAKAVSVASGHDYNFDLENLAKKVNGNSRAIIVQNTFGIPADTRAIAKIVGSKVTIIEDCAHALGIKVSGKIAFFSFGRDKIISSIFGGMILTSSKDLFVRLKSLRDELAKPPLAWTIQQLLHPIALSLVLPAYTLGPGKLILVILQKLNILSRAVYPEEKRGGHPEVFPAKMPAALAILALNQLKKLERFNKHRKKIAQFYFDNLELGGVVLPPDNKDAVWLRFPIKVSDGPGLLKYTKQRNIVLGDWYKDSDKNVVNLPTYPLMTLDDAKRVVEVVKGWINLES